MKKILLGLTLMLSLVFLISCNEITGEYNQSQRPSIELIDSGGDLLQHYEESSQLEDVNYEVTFKQFTENNINLEDVVIVWYSRNVEVARGSDTTYTQVVNSPENVAIRVEVILEFEGKELVLTADSLIEVVRTKTSIVVTNSVDANNHRVNIKLGGETNLVTFTGVINGNLNLDFKWVILRETNNEPELIEEIDVTELEITGSAGTATLTYNFNLIERYVVRLQTGDSESQDASVYLSNSTYINVNFGEFALFSNDKLVLSETEGFTQRTLNVTPLDVDLVGEGTYEWYLDGKKLVHSGTEYVHNETELGSFLYEVNYVLNELDENDEQVVVKADPLLIINGKEVSNQEELESALKEQVPGIILTNGFEYKTEGESLDIKYPTAIYGNGHTINSSGVEVFINVTSDNVYLSNLTIKDAQRYNLMYSEVDMGYLENVNFENIGGGSMTELLGGAFGSGLFVNKSEVTIKNIEFLSGGMVGVRVDNDGAAKAATLNVLGTFKYNLEDPIALPIGSGKSPSNGVVVNHIGFDYFSLPAGNITIRRWDNQGDPVTWQLASQDKTKYVTGEALDLFGIGISVDIGFLGINIDGENGLEFVKEYIDIFKEYGTIKITTLNDEIKNTYYIIGFTEEQVYGLDKIIYSETPDFDAEAVRPDLPSTEGQYKVKIYIGDEFYLGDIIIDVLDAETE